MRVGELNAILSVDGKSQFDRDVDSAGRKFSSLGTLAKNAGQAMATSVVATSAVMVGLGAAVFKTGVEYNALQQSSRAALTTLLGSAEKANAQMDLLDDFARNSPFAKDVFIRAQQQLIGFGIAAEDVIPILGAVQDATAAVGGSNQDIADIVTTLSKISSTGKITAEDLNELGNKGIDAATLMGAEFGKTAADIRKDITDGKITAEEAIDAIVNQMNNRFGGAAANVKETWVGATDRIKAAWRDIGSDLAKPFVDPNGGGRAIRWVNDLADVMRAMQKQVAPLMGILMDRWGKDLDKITPYLTDLKSRIDALDMSVLTKALDALDGYGPIIAGLATAFGAWGTASLPIIGGINPLVAGVTALVLATPALRDGLGGVVLAAAPLVDMLGTIGVQVADLAMKVISEFAPAFFDLAEAVVEAAVPLGGEMLQAVSGLLALASPFVSLLSEIVGWMSELPDSVLLAGTAFLLLKGNLEPLTGVVNTVRGAFDNFQLQRHLSQMEGMGGAASVAGGAFGSLAIQAQRVGTALKTAFISSAPALAIAGLVTVLGNFASKSAEADALVADLAASLDQVTGAATDATTALINTKLEEAGILKAYQDAGGNVRDFALALTGTGYAAEAAEARIVAWAETLGVEYINNGQKAIDKGEEVLDTFYGIGEATDEATESTKRLSEANADTSGTEAQIEARERLTEIMSGEIETLESLIDARRREQGEVMSITEAQMKHATARDQLNKAIESEGELLDQNTGLYSGYTERGQAATQAAQSYLDTMIGMAESMTKNKQSTEEIIPVLSAMREEWIDGQVAMGLTREQAEALADTLGLIPTDVAIEMSADTGPVDATLADLLIDIDLASGSVTIAGKRAELDQTLGEVIGDVDEATGTVSINGNRLPADMTVDELLTRIDTSEEWAKINADDEAAQRELLGFEGDVKAAEEFAKINATDGQAQNVLSRLETDVTRSESNIKIGANPGSLQTWLNSVSGSILGTAYLNIRPTGGLANHVPVANGAIFEAYAQGGIRENHVAQIAPAGAWRVWAEPETGGEAYIPLAPWKRPRSEQILAEVADRFGMMTIPRPTAYASGGVTTAQPATQTNMSGFPSTLILRVGERDILGIVEETIDGHPAVRMVTDFSESAARARKART